MTNAETRLDDLEKRVNRLEGKRALSQSTDLKLCYVEGHCAYFTTQPLDKQWGDDWNDAPYEHNAGTPYVWREGYSEEAQYTIERIMFTAELGTPADHAWSGNSQFSVEDINSGKIAWLSGNGINIFAGCSPEEFKQLVCASGGTVYKPDND